MRRRRGGRRERWRRLEVEAHLALERRMEFGQQAGRRVKLRENGEGLVATRNRGVLDQEGTSLESAEVELEERRW